LLGQSKRFFKKYSLSKKLLQTLKAFKVNSPVNFFRKRHSLKVFSSFKKSRSIFNKSKTVKIEQKTREYLQKIYQDEIKNLEKLINRDLSFWQ